MNIGSAMLFRMEKAILSINIASRNGTITSSLAPVPGSFSEESTLVLYFEQKKLFYR